MRAQVTWLTQTEDEIFVSFRTQLGTFVARWASKVHAPLQGKEYEVELDLDCVLGLNSNTRAADGVAPKLFNEGDQIVVQATVEAVDDDGMAYLRLARDCLIMVQTT